MQLGYKISVALSCLCLRYIRTNTRATTQELFGHNVFLPLKPKQFI